MSMQGRLEALLRHASCSQLTSSKPGCSWIRLASTKVRQQHCQHLTVLSAEGPGVPCLPHSKSSALKRLRAGIWNCGETVIKEEGVRALWKGLTPFAAHLTLKYALRMGTNATYQTLLRDQVP